MLRLPSRATARLAQSSLAPARTIPGRRFASTQPTYLRRSWKSSAARWGIAVAGIYFYTTSPIFAEQPSNNLLNPNLDKLEDETSGTSLEALTSRPRRQQSKEASVLASAAEVTSTENASTTADPNILSSPEDLEEEADQQGAFNPETGEINWDCSCLGGMAHGPCGPQFREAFSCFVYSTEEPKGMDCIEKFQGMQDCFKEHPDVYKAELDEGEDDGEYDEAMAAEKEELVKEIKERREKAGIEADGRPSQKRLLEESPAPARETKPTKSKKPASTGQPDAKSEQNSAPPASEAKTSTEAQLPAKESVNEGQSSPTVRKPNPPSPDNAAVDEADEPVPKASHDARS